MAILVSGINRAETTLGFEKEEYANGMPLPVLMPSLDRHGEHIHKNFF